MPGLEVEIHMLLHDAGRLIQRYHGRERLTLDQKREWVRDVVEVLEALAGQYTAIIERPGRAESGDLTRTWVTEFRAGRRVPKPYPGEW